MMHEIKYFVDLKKLAEEKKNEEDLANQYYKHMRQEIKQFKDNFKRLNKHADTTRNKRKDVAIERQQVHKVNMIFC